MTAIRPERSGVNVDDTPVAVSSLASTPTVTRGDGEEPTPRESPWVSVLWSTDHKVVGMLYLYTALGFFLLAGIMAMMIRAELATPGLDLVQSKDQYNQLFTMHGTLMLLQFATPMFAAFANLLVPIQIGAPDVAFPRLNMLSYWMYLFGSLIVVSGFLLPGGAASFGWTAYAPLSDATYSPGLGGNLWVLGLALGGFSTILGAVNFLTTIVCLRAPGMTMFRLSLFCWNIVVTSLLVIIAFPLLAAALFGLAADRIAGAQLFVPENGGALLWQHLFWFFGHPEVYIVALPFFGIVSEIIPVFSRKPIFGYRGMVYATIVIGALSVAVWAHHMFVTGQVSFAFFAGATMLIAIPTGIKFFNWIGTMWRGSLSFETPMLWCLGFLVTFLFGGLTGVILSAPPLDWHVTDTYFVVAHFHYVLFGTVVFATFGGFYFWWPKWTGRFLDEKLGTWHFWTTFIGFQITFLIQHWLGAAGMPRRVADYLPEDGYTLANRFSTAGAFLLAISMAIFLVNLGRTMRRPRAALAADPWGHGRSLEWATASPVPRHNFLALPRIRSESPAFDLHHPEAALAEVVPPRRTGQEPATGDPTILTDLLGDAERTDDR
ncbi:MAG: cytochrome c oxidase subunit I [Kineosporiaceae bacterium]|nr:cytochrome c oxidase subunit I [Kineosporiaceae bacterium]